MPGFARAALLAALAAAPIAAQQPAAPAPFRVEGATIASVQQALRAGRITCRALVAHYLRRIEAYDRRGPAINAITVVHPRAREVADSLDGAMRRAPREVGAMHCVPLIVKENFETADLPTTAGSLALRGFRSGRDATMVRRLREAGALILAKSNMAELAFSPYETVSSAHPGYTRNPYALDRTTAGSSGGTAAAVAADLGLVGLGTDTGNSIRGPSAHQALVGIRSTMGLTSRAGIAPLFLSQDVAGPMARTVADAAAVLQVVAGHDPADTATAAAREHPAPRYADSLRRDGLRGARIGVLATAYLTATTDSEVVRVLDRAIADLRRLGATVTDSVTVPELDSLRRLPGGGPCNPFRHDFEAWLAEHGDRAPVRSLDSLVRSRRFHPGIEARLTAALADTVPPERVPGCQARERFRAGLRAAVLRVMDEGRYDALVYPTWSNPPRLIGDLNTPHGDNSQLFSPSTGFPALTVPLGWTREGRLPAGLQMLGRPWSEGTLIRLAYAYEQGTRHRRAPRSTPPM